MIGRCGELVMKSAVVHAAGCRRTPQLGFGRHRSFALQAEKMRLMREAYADVQAMLQPLKAVVEKVADELYEHHELTGARVKEILDEATA